VTPLLEEVALDNNRLTLGDASAFDNCPKLKSVVLSHNNISSDLFTFEGTTKLETLEANHNMIRGGVPSQWGQLKSCEKIVLSYNRLEASLKPMQTMAALTYLDMVSSCTVVCEGDVYSNTEHTVEHCLITRFVSSPSEPQPN
jgi:hypothetical protein